MGFDFRLAWSSLRREPLLSLLVVLILAVSLGVHTAVFSLVHAAFFRPLPYADAERLVVVQSVSSLTGGAYGLSVPDADDYHASAERLAQIGTFTARRDNLVSLDGKVHSLPSALVTVGVLPATGVRPVLGRLFFPEDDMQGADSFKVLISHHLWQSYFGGDPDILQRSLQTSLGTFSILGVLPSGYGFPEGAQMWFPYQSWIDTQDSGDLRQDQRAMRWPQGLALLAPGATIEQASAELDGLANHLGETLPKTNADWRPRLTPYREHTLTGLEAHLRSLFAMAWLFTALAAVNLAGLQLARGVARTATFSLQIALGDRGLRLARQLLMENLLLTVPGAFGGLALAHLLLALLPRFVPNSLPHWLEPSPGAAGLGFAALAAVLIALFAGLAPLIISSRLDLRALLAGRTAASARGGRLRKALVVAQVALASVLLVGAGLLARSFGTLDRIEPGFATEGVVSVELSPQLQGSYLEQTDGLSSLYQRLQARLLDTPGVVAVGGTTHLPYFDRDRRPVKLVARGGEGEDELEHQAPILTVDITPGYFDSLGIPIVDGRDFSWADRRDEGLVIILSRRAAEQLFPGQSAIGQEARIANDSWARVVGVVGDVRYDPRETDYGAELYYPITQYKAWRQRLTVRLEGPPEALLPSVRRAFEEAAPETGVVEIRTLRSILDESLWQSRLLGRLAPLFAAIALLLASFGVYGMLTHDLARKRQEIGVRAALGAPRRRLGTLVLLGGMRLVALGVTVGVVGGVLAAPLLAASLFGVESRDPWSFVLAALALFIGGVGACLAPAKRAMQVHPAEALRES